MTLRHRHPRARGRSGLRAGMLLLTLPLASCSGGGSGDAADGITVFAASSLKRPFDTIATGFRKAHPQRSVKFVFAASSSLATQIRNGAPADVFASASPEVMDGLRDGHLAGSPVAFATNTLQIAVRPGYPDRISGLADLADGHTTVAVCQRAAPCGRLAARVLTTARVRLTPVSYEADAAAVLSKVRLGEVDAGVVYRTDVLGAGGGVTGVSIPAAVNATTSYPIAVLSGSADPDTARAFVEAVRSPDGEAVLTAAGFGPP